MTWAIGIAWHGFLGYPSMMPIMMGYGIDSWSPVVILITLPLFVLGGAFYGWIFATSWNYFAKK